MKLKYQNKLDKYTNYNVNEIDIKYGDLLILNVENDNCVYKLRIDISGLTINKEWNGGTQLIYKKELNK